MTTYRVHLREQLVVMLNQYNGGISFIDNDDDDIYKGKMYTSGIYRIIWHTVPWSYNPFLPLLIRQGMVLYVSMVLY